MSNNYKNNRLDDETPRLRFVFSLGNRGGVEENRMDEDETRREDVPSSDERNRDRRDSHSSTGEDTEWHENDDEWVDEGCSDCSSVEEGDNKKNPSNPKVLTLPKPKHSWFVVKEVLKRETGDFKTPLSFTKRFYGSLHAVQRLELMYKLDKHSGCVNAINFNKSGTRLISGSDDKLVAVWNWAEGKCLSTFQTGHSSNVFQCKYLPLTGDGHIVTCSRDGFVRLALQNSTGGYEASQVLAQHSRSCHKISVIQQEPHSVISAGADAQVFFIDVREKKPNRLLFVKEQGKKISLYSVHVNPLNGNEFCVSGEDSYIRIYDRRHINRNGQADIKFGPSHLTKPSSVYVTSAVFNYNGSEIIGSYNDDDIYLFDTKHQSEADFVHRYEGHRNSETVKGVNFFGPKSEFVVSGSDCGNIYIWDKNTEAIVQWMRGDEEGVINCIEPHPKIPVLATSGLDTDVKIWVPSCEHEPTMDGLEKAVKFNRKKRSCRSIGSRASLNDTLVRWWRQMRFIHNQRFTRESGPLFIGVRDLVHLERLDRYDDSSSHPSSSSSSSSDDDSIN